MPDAALTDRLRCYDASDGRRLAVETYRNVRLGMLVLIAALATSIGLVIADERTVGPSISWYFHTAAHGVFIATICAMGALLIVYKGQSQVEDALLNNAGFLAFIVALVPTRGPLPFDVDNGVWVMVIAGLLSQGIWLVRDHLYPAVVHHARVAWWVVGVYVVGVGILLSLLSMFLWWRRTFDDDAHNIAAISMFAMLSLVVASNAAMTHSRRYRVMYVVITAAMVGFTGAALIVGFTRVSVFYLETFLLAAFAAFWMVQTFELRGVSTRDQLPRGAVPARR